MRQKVSCGPQVPLNPSGWPSHPGGLNRLPARLWNSVPRSRLSLWTPFGRYTFSSKKVNGSAWHELAGPLQGNPVFNSLGLNSAAPPDAPPDAPQTLSQMPPQTPPKTAEDPPGGLPPAQTGLLQEQASKPVCGQGRRSGDKEALSPPLLCKDSS